MTGTSASAAEVAAAAALLRANDPGASNGVIVGRLARNADAAGTVDQTGNGRLNLGRALGDTSTDVVQPVGAAPFGGGGPFVGPYVAAATNTVTQIARTSGVSPSTYGTSLTFTASVTQQGNGNTITQGTLEFRDGSKLLTSPVVQAANPLDGSGQVTFITTSLVVASHTIRACYLGFGSGGSAIRTSEGSLSQTVTKADLTVTADNKSRAYGTANPTLTATLSGFANGGDARHRRRDRHGILHDLRDLDEPGQRQPLHDQLRPGHADRVKLRLHDLQGPVS